MFDHELFYKSLIKLGDNLQELDDYNKNFGGAVEFALGLLATCALNFYKNGTVNKIVYIIYIRVRAIM